MSGHMGFGRESVHGPPRPVDRFYPFIQAHEAVCEVCGAIKPQDEMDWFDTDEDGTPLYRCAPCTP